MNNTWLCFMLLPFMAGVLIHFMVPIQFILTSNPKIEEAYNTIEIEVEQSTVRAVSYLNAEIITDRIQLYENIRGTFVRIFDHAGQYEIIKESAIALNSAYQLANSPNASEENLNKSMWYVPGVASLA